MEHNKIKIGITQGDINGTSYEIMIKTFQEQRFSEICTPVIYGSPKVVAFYRKALNVNNFAFNLISKSEDAADHKANIVNVLDDNAKVEMGQATVMAGEAAVTSIDAAVADLAEGKISAVVLNPVNARLTANLNVTDQMDYIRRKTGSDQALPILVNDVVKVALLSGAIPMRDISKHITIDNIVAKLHVIDNALKSDFGIDKPKIAVLGYNPRFADSLSPEREENDVIAPAIEKAKDENVFAMGPYDADYVFGTGLFRQFDAVLAIYYEQGVLPFRALSYGNGACYMAGMPQLCVSTFQNVGYDDAGLDKADPCTFQNAIYLACDIMANREQYKQLTSNQLKKHNISD